jgi:hypothetical protein
VLRRELPEQVMISQDGALVDATVRRAGFAEHWHTVDYRPMAPVFNRSAELRSSRLPTCAWSAAVPRPSTDHQPTTPWVLLKTRFSSKLIVHRFEPIAQKPEDLQ